MAIYTFEQALKKTGATPDKISSLSEPIGTSETQSPSFIQSVKTNIAKRGENVFKQSERNQSAGSDVLQFLGQGAGLVGDIAAEGVKKVGEVTGVTDFAKEKLKPVAVEILNTEIGKAGIEAIKGGVDMYNQWKEANPEAAANLEAVVNIGTILPVGKFTKVAGETALDVKKSVAGGVLEAGSKAIKAVEPVIDTTKSFATGVKDIGLMTFEGAKNIPSRIATNVAEKQATREAIQQLPTQVAKKAVQDGVDMLDVKQIYSIPKEQKPLLKKLYQSAKDFETGVSKTNPIEIVGEPIVKRVKVLESEAGKIGQKLGEVANTIPNVSSDELLNPILSKLQSISGLEGIAIDEKGLLNFDNTVLRTAETASDRNAIQSIFSQAIKGETGKQKHLLRQELFEVLGGKKKGGVSLTDTQDKAYQAIRQGLSDVLDTKSPTYKKLNLEYAKVANPLAEIRRALKASGSDEDLANMSAGLLARRLTSMAKSNPEVRSLLRRMDRATKKKGTSTGEIEALQDFYNILDRYYNIEGKTSLQGQTKLGVEKASGIQDVAMQAVGQIAGKTEAVRRKAIEQVLDDILR
jgi:hypothetical protein